MDGGEGPAQIGPYRRHLILSEAPFAAQPLLEGLSLEQIGPEAHATSGFRGTVHDEDIAVPHPREPSRLSQEPAGIHLHVRSHELEREVLPQSRVVGPEHLATGSFTYLRDDL